MKKIKRLIATLVAVCCIGSVMMTSTACGKKKGQSSSSGGGESSVVTDGDIGGATRSRITLDVMVTNAGYGIDWLKSALEEFAKQDWVKEKYPRLNIPAVEVGSIDAMKSQITASGSKYDLFVSAHELNSQIEKKVAGEYCVQDLSIVYNSKVPGESITVKEKMLESLAESQVIERGGQKIYASMPWVNGTMGISYNEKRLNALRTLNSNISSEMPRTTLELLTMIEEVDEALDGGERKDETDQAVLVPVGTRYENGILNNWWAQYEGIDGYNNYWNGVDAKGDPSVEIFSQQGRLEALTVLENMLVAYGEGGDGSDVGRFQNRYLMGWGVFMINGDWLYNELGGAQAVSEWSEVFNLRWLQAPVVSSIVDKLEQVKTDGQLSFVIKCIDEGKDYNNTKTAYADANHGELNQDDYNTVYEARKIVDKLHGHSSYVPAYAEGKYVAMDFLRFLATDKGNEIVMNKTKGMLTPYVGWGENNYKVSDSALSAFAPMLQDRIRQTQAKSISLPDMYSYKTYYQGGLYPWTKYISPSITLLATDAVDRASARDIWEADIKYYTANDSAMYDSMMKRAGLLG